MTQKVLKEDIFKYLNKIYQSSTFVKSPRSARLLKFVAEQSILGNFLKEQIIGLELFNKNYNPQTNDAKVRVYMHNLRKRLKEYYENEGCNDKVIIDIKKGQYNATFYNKNNKPCKAKKISTITISSLIFSLVIFGLIFIQKNSSPLFIWNEFFNNNSETICLISDHKILFGKLPDGSMGFIRNPSINREKELVEYLQKHKDLNFQVPDFTFITKMAPIAVHDLTNWFLSHNKDFNVIIEADFSFETIKDKNLILIGQSKSMGKTSSLLLRNSKVFFINNDVISYKSGIDTKYFHSSIINNKRVDYALVSFGHLENKKPSLIITSNNDIGVIACVKNFTDPKWLKDFHSIIPKDIREFNALFRVSGLGRTDLGFELEEIEYITK